MLRLHTGRDAQGAKAYFEQGLSREDYYAEGLEVTGHWFGRGAEHLGLSGPVDRDDFHALCENRHPQSGERLTARTKANRRVGFDISFSVPKSVSIHHALTEDPAILEAFKAAVRETMAEMERDAETRVRKRGANHNRTTGNLAWAEFIHYTARPVEGRADPHLHAHCWTFNTTYDDVEERWKALDLEAVWQRAPYYEAAFEARLAKRLQALGFRIDRSGKGWELKGYSRALVESFSRRTQLINAFAAARGIETDQLKDELGARTREAKGEGEDKAQQRAEWFSRLRPEEREAIVEIERSRKGGPASPHAPRLTAAACLEVAIDHCFERQSVVREDALLAEALRFGVGDVTPGEIETAHADCVANRSILQAEINGHRHVTTPAVLAEESAMVSWARQGRGTRPALGDTPKARTAALGSLTPDGRTADPDQVAAVAHMLTSQDRVILLRGKAGTGKTTIMTAVRDGIEAGGTEVHFFAPGAEASRGVLASEGFKDATTVARLLQDEKLQQKVQGQVIWVDEAGTLGARDMHQLFHLADAVGARVVLAGDVSQHAPVARGDALRILESEAGLKPAELTRVYRQKGRAYREAVEALSTGDARAIATGFDRLDAMGAVKEVDSERRYAELATAYLEAVLEEKKTALVVSPTHGEGEKVTRAVRDGLRKASALDSDERRVTRLRSLSLTEAERAQPASYDKGLVVQVHGRVKGLKRGEHYEVAHTDRNAVTVRPLRGGSDETITLPLSQAKAFDVFVRDALALSKGDTVRITRNGMAVSRSPAGRKQELRNGAMYEVAGFTDNGDIRAVSRSKHGRVTNEITIGRDFGNLTHGYCVTSHASQGKTVDRVLVAQSAMSLRASSREQFYVSVSRGREAATIFTDNKQALKSRVMASGARMSASDFSRTQQRQRRHAEQHVRRTHRLLQDARDYARRQAELMIRNARALVRTRERGRDGPQRQL